MKAQVKNVHTTPKAKIEVAQFKIRRKGCFYYDKLKINRDKNITQRRQESKY